MMRTVKTEPGILFLMLVVSLLLAKFGGGPARAWLAADAADQRVVATRPAVRSLAAGDGLDPIAAYDPTDHRLDIFPERLRVDVLICIGKTCGLTQEWDRWATEASR